MQTAVLSLRLPMERFKLKVCDKYVYDYIFDERILKARTFSYRRHLCSDELQLPL